MITNGLYLFNSKALDGFHGGAVGVLMLHDGKLHGGDSFFYFTGTYSCFDGKLKGEMIHQEHTKAPIWRPMAGRVVSVGFSGTYTDKSAEVGFTALVGKRSMRYDASLRLLVADDRVTTRTQRPDSSPDIGVQQQSSRGPLA
jgi:T3SS negative regulator,GrlR